MDGHDMLRDMIADAIYADGDKPEWLTTVDGSPNAASYEIADRVLEALSLDATVQEGWLCKHGAGGPYAARGDAPSCGDETATPTKRLSVGKYVGPWFDAR